MTSPAIQPYLFFDGRCEEAIDFYRSALGAEVEMMLRFSECPDPPPPGTMPDGWEKKVMHAAFRIDGSLVLASDGCGSGSPFEGFALSLSVATAEQADRYFNALAEGGEVTMPLDQTFWSPRFGMVTDRFGLGWMVGVEADPASSGQSTSELSG